MTQPVFIPDSTRQILSRLSNNFYLTAINEQTVFDFREDLLVGAVPVICSPSFNPLQPPQLHLAMSVVTDPSNTGGDDPKYGQIYYTIMSPDFEREITRSYSIDDFGLICQNLSLKWLRQIAPA